MDEVFYKISKIIIFLPIVVVIIALIIKFNEKQSFSFQQQQKNNYQTKISPSLFLSKTPSKKPEKIGINLNDHWVCQYDFNNQKYKLEINKRKINLEILENGNVKNYDLSFYGGIIENYLNMDINQLEEISKFYLPKGISLKSLIEGCKRL